MVTGGVTRQCVDRNRDILGVIDLVRPVFVEQRPLLKRRTDVLPPVPTANGLVEDEGGEAHFWNASTADQIAVFVGEGFPGSDTLERRWLSDRGRPLFSGKPGVAAHAHGTIAPWQCSNPLDGIVAIGS